MQGVAETVFICAYLELDHLGVLAVLHGFHHATDVF